MKKAWSGLLIAVLLLALLPAAAFASDGAVRSDRGLRADGKRVPCEVYDIGGECYYKLRDVAMALRSTGSRFSVAWDGERRAVSLTTGEAYEPVGGEGDLSGGDKGTTAVPSTHAVMIDGAAAELRGYNVGGSNYYRLEDLGEALGFRTDYDEESDTAILLSKVWFEPRPWLTEELTITDNTGFWHHEIYTYGEDGRTLSNLSEGLRELPGIPEPVSYGSTTYFHYDELGRKTEYVSVPLGASEEEGRVVSSFEYDKWGQMVRNAGEGGSYNTSTYDASGNLTAIETVNVTPVGELRSGVYMDYDEAGRLIRNVAETSGVVVGHYEYSYDAQGRAIREESFDAAGNRLYVKETVEYDGDMPVKTVQDYGSYSTVTTTTYDEESRTYVTVTESPSGVSRILSTVNEAGDPLRQEWQNEAGSSVTVYTYDEAGRLLREVTGDPEDPASVTSYTYDEEGRVLTDVYEEGGCREENVYTYDRAARKMTHTRTTTYPEASSLVFYQENVTLPVGGSTLLFFGYMPRNALAEAVTWSSSDPEVAAVDERGTVTAVSPGVATVTVTSLRGLTVSCTVTVTEAPG